MPGGPDAEIDPDPGRDLVARIEEAALWAWPPREVRGLHGWLLRAGAGGGRRANSVRTLAFDAPPRRLEAVIGEVAAWYAARDRPARYQLARHAAPAGLDEALAARGYARVAPTVVTTAGAGRFDPAAAEGVDLLHRPGQAALDAMADPLWHDAPRRERAALLARIRRPHRFGLVTVDGVPAACGLVVLDGFGGPAGLFALRTQAPFRRRGLGRRLVLGLAAWARAAGAGLVYAEAEEANGAALALLAAAGLAASHRHWYREAAGD